jgi:AraC-like DNA-binding protein
MGVAPMTWDLPLGLPPRIRMASAVARHGERAFEAYRLSGFWCVNLYHGPCTWRIDGTCLPLNRGWATITPPDRAHEYEFPAPIEKSWVHFIPSAQGRRMAMPAVIDLGAAFAAAVDDVAFIARYHWTEAERAQARLWDLLWRLQARGFTATTEADPDLLEKVGRIVRRRITERLRTGEIARELGWSTSQLNRLLQRETGRSLGEVIADIRLEQAAHLLQHSDLPIGEVARRVGIGNAQRFNKVVRASFRMSPRELRRRSSPDAPRG